MVKRLPNGTFPSKITRKIADQIKAEHQGFAGDTKALAAKYGVSPQTIYRIITGQAWRKSELSEFHLHKQLVKLLEATKKPEVRYFHVANERVCSGREGAKFKSLGVKPGIPDLVFVLPNGEVRWMEVKKPGGKLSAHQKDWHEFLNRSGQRCVVVFGLDDAIEIFKLWDILRGNVKIMSRGYKLDGEWVKIAA